MGRREAGASRAFAPAARGCLHWSLTRPFLFPTVAAPSLDAPTRRSTLAVLFFCTALPMGMWGVPMANIFSAYDRGHLVPWVLATSGIAAFISPLFVGALADQRVSPTHLMRWLSLATGAALAMTCLALYWRLPDGVIIACAQIQALIATPVWSVANSIVMASLPDPKRQFGPVRACATLGWMAGCVVVSFVLKADKSVVAGFTAASLWVGVMLMTWTLPVIPPGDGEKARGWRQILGLDALSLLRHRDNRVVFITAALYNIPLAAFYPYTSKHMEALQVERVSALMSVAQISEILTMVLLAGLLARFRLKWVFLSGIAICVLRYALYAGDSLTAVVVGTSLHGFAFTLYFITTQIYLEERIDPRWRVRAQALLTLLMSGVGNVIGYLGGGWWFQQCQQDGKTNWSQFWWGETALTAAVCLFFALAYRGKRAEPDAKELKAGA